MYVATLSFSPNILQPYPWSRHGPKLPDRGYLHRGGWPEWSLYQKRSLIKFTLTKVVQSINCRSEVNKIDTKVKHSLHSNFRQYDKTFVLLGLVCDQLRTRNRLLCRLQEQHELREALQSSSSEQSLAHSRSLTIQPRAHLKSR